MLWKGEVTTTARAQNNGTKNLIPVNMRTKEEARKISSNGGKASGEARRKKRDARQAAKFVLGLEPNLSKETRAALEKMGLKPDETPDIRLISILAIAQKAMKGDLQANKMLLEMAGDVDARTKIEQERLKIECERLKLEKERAEEASGDELPQIVIKTYNRGDGGDA